MKALADDTRMRIFHILKDGDLCVCEIEAILNISQSNASRHLTKLTNAGLVESYKVTKYVYYKLNEKAFVEFDFLNSVVRQEAMKLEQCKLDYERLKKHKESGLGCEDLKEGRILSLNNNSDQHLAENMEKIKVAFVCVHNSCRSQMAEALGKLYGEKVFEAYSAGTEVKPQINQDAVKVIKKLYGIDMNETQYSKLLAEIPSVDIVIKMGCNVDCPYMPAVYVEDWGLEDPTGKSEEEFINTAKLIEIKVKNLVYRINNNEIRGVINE